MPKLIKIDQCFRELLRIKVAGLMDRGVEDNTVFA